MTKSHIEEREKTRAHRKDLYKLIYSKIFGAVYWLPPMMAAEKDSSKNITQSSSNRIISRHKNKAKDIASSLDKFVAIRFTDILYRKISEKEKMITEKELIEECFYDEYKLIEEPRSLEPLDSKQQARYNILIKPFLKTLKNPDKEIPTATFYRYKKRITVDLLALIFPVVISGLMQETDERYEAFRRFAAKIWEQGPEKWFRNHFK